MAYDDPNEPWPGFNTPHDAAHAVQQDRVRVATILDSAEGRRNPAMARKLALERGMDAAGALDILAAIPGTENPHGASDSVYARALLKEGASGLETGGSATIGGDPRAARIAELRQVGKRHGEAKGYRTERAG